MKFKLEIGCDNAAFGETEETCREELVSIFKQLTTRKLWVAWEHETPLRDSNGNHVGFAKFEGGGAHESPFIL